jgi:co-chaperonin GroES (HSP10)
VLLKPYEVEMKVGAIIIADTSKQRMEMADQRAVVIAIGPEAWSEEKEPRAKVGDRVMITKYGGMFVTGPGDGQQYRMVNDKDIFCVITDEKHEVSYV